MISAAPPAPARPRPVFCVLGHAHRDLRVAESVCAGRFTHAGITRELGLPPDWLGAELPADDTSPWSSRNFDSRSRRVISLGNAFIGCSPSS